MKMLGTLGRGFCFLWMLIIFLQSTPAQGALQEDLHGVLPLPGADHSPAVAGIRHALELHDVRSAQGSIDTLRAAEPSNFEGDFWQGVLNFQQRDYPDAIRSLRSAQKLDANLYVLKLLGLSYYFVGQFRLFTMTMEDVIRKNPADFAAYYWLGRFHASKDALAFGSAITDFQEALRRKPDHYPSHYYLGFCYESEHKLGDAEAEYRRALQLAEDAHETFPLPYQGLARLKLLETHPADALPLATKAISLDPDNPAAHMILAHVYADLHDQQRSASEWERASALAPNDPLPLYHLYRIYLERGEKEKADRTFRKYNELVAIYGRN